jgi:hypothetical protein
MGKIFLLNVVKTGSAALLASYPMGTAVKRPEGEADHSPAINAEDENAWIHTSTPPYVFMA